MKANRLVKLVFGIAMTAAFLITGGTGAALTANASTSADFVCAIRASGSANPAADYNTLSAWETAIGSDLTSLSSKVFTVSSRGAYVPSDDGAAVTFTGGGAGVLRHINASNKAYITNCAGAINTGIVTCLSQNTFTISDTGVQIGHTIAECYNDWPTGLVDNLVLDGFTANKDHYVKIYAPAGQKHIGIAGTGFRLKCGSSGLNAILISGADCGWTRIEGIEIMGPDAHVSNEYGIMTNQNAAPNCEISGNIIHGFTGCGGRGICQRAAGTRVYRNRIYDVDNAGISCNDGSSEAYYYNNIIYNSGMYGIVVSSSSSGPSHIYNNTIYNCASKGVYFASANSEWHVKNNVVMACASADFDLNGAAGTTAAGGAVEAAVTNNLSSDATAPGPNSLIKKTVSDVKFVSLTAGYEDLRIEPSSHAVSAAANLSGVFADDIDGHTRVGWDIGADEAAAEFVCAIRPAGKTNPAPDYNNLSAWAGAAAGTANLTSNATRVFSGSKIGAVSDNAAVTLYREGVKQSVTGTCVHAGTSQILVKDISNGAFSFAPSDQWRVRADSYFSITNAGDTAAIAAECYNDWPDGLSDTLSISGSYPYYSDSEHAIIIRAPLSERHNGTARDGFYLKPAPGAVHGIVVNQPVVGVKIQGIEVDGAAASASALTTYFRGIIIEPDSAGYDFEISNCLIHDCGPASLNSVGITTSDVRAPIHNVKIFNNIIYNTASYGISLSDTSGGYVYNNTVYNAGAAAYASASAASAASVRQADSIFAVNAGADLLKNNIAISPVADKDFEGTFASGSGYNASMDATAPGAYSLKSVMAVDNFINVDTTSGAEDLRLKHGSVCVNKGVDLSSDAYIRFNTDIEGDIRGTGAGAWSIGADEYAALVISNLTGQQNAGHGIVTLSYTGAHSEVDSECAYISSDCAYSLNSTNGADGTWRAMTRNDSGIETFTTAGVNLSYDWNACADAPDTENAQARVRLRVKDPNNRRSNLAVSAPFALDTKAPTGLADLKVAAVGASSAMLTWNPAKDTNFKTYRIWYGAKLDDVEQMARSALKWDSSNDANLASAAALAVTIKGITWGADTYYFKIWAVDNYGNESSAQPGGCVSTANPERGVAYVLDSAEPTAAQTEEAAEADEEISEEALDLEKLLTRARPNGAELYDILIRIPDPGQSAETKTHYDGELALVIPYGNNWSETERKSYLIIPTYLTNQEAASLTAQQQDKKCKINLGKLGLGKAKIKRGKQNTDEINLLLENKRVRWRDRKPEINRRESD